MKLNKLSEWGFAAPSILTLVFILVWLCFDEPKMSLWWCFAPVIIQIAMILVLIIAITVLWAIGRNKQP